MFEAKLISDPAYYSLRRMQLIYMFLPAFPIAILVNYSSFAPWLIVLASMALLMIFYFGQQNIKQMNEILNRCSINLDKDEIKIISNQDDYEERIALNENTSIVIKKDYSLPQQTIKDLTRELLGQPKKNYIIVQRDDVERKLTFELDSNYVIRSLHKTLNLWRHEGYKIIKEE